MAQLVVDRGISGTPEIPEAEAYSGPTRLLASSPNPFREQTVIRYALGQAGRVKLVVYDLSGRQVRRLWDGRRSAGQYSLVWDGRDDAGRGASVGVYFLRMQAGSWSRSQRLLHVK